jgi:hypothetical protein
MTDDSLDDRVYPFPSMYYSVLMCINSYTGRYKLPNRCGDPPKHVCFGGSCGASTQPT